MARLRRIIRIVGWLLDKGRDKMHIETEGTGALARFTLVGPSGISEIGLADLLNLNLQISQALNVALAEGVMIPSSDPEPAPAPLTSPANPPMLRGEPPAPIPIRPLPKLPTELNPSTGNPVPKLAVELVAARALANPKGVPLCPGCRVETVACQTNGSDSLPMHKCPKCEEYVSA